MDNLREKLVKLLCEASSLSVDAELFEDSSYAQQLEIEADFLIANGVTVQRWIPVTERLPEDSATVNLCTRSRIVGTGFYDKYTKSWVQYYSAGSILVDVTHWMPLPEPPKEVE